MKLSEEPKAKVAQAIEDYPVLARFTSPNFAVKDERGENAEALRAHFFDAAGALVFSSPPSKSLSVALTELETAMMWGIKAFYGAPGE